MVSTFSLKPASKLSKSFFQIFFLHGLLYTILWTASIIFIITFPFAYYPQPVLICAASGKGNNYYAPLCYITPGLVTNGHSA